MTDDDIHALLRGDDPRPKRSLVRAVLLACAPGFIIGAVVAAYFVGWFS